MFAQSLWTSNVLVDGAGKQSFHIEFDNIYGIGEAGMSCSLTATHPCLLQSALVWVGKHSVNQNIESPFFFPSYFSVHLLRSCLGTSVAFRG